MDIKALSEKYDSYIVEQRRWFHERPELSYQEVETTKAIKDRLEAMGIPVTTFDGLYGCVGEIKGGKGPG